MSRRLFTGPGSIRRLILDVLACIAIFAAPFVTLYISAIWSN